MFFTITSKDLAKFPDGDETEVGEHGLTLSGGQKARVALARVAYASTAAAALVILDDPLASVDPGVGAQIFTNCLRNHMRDRLCLFITNQPHLLSQCDLIVVLHEGRLETSGTYDQLVSEGFDFVSLTARNDGKVAEVPSDDPNLVNAGEKVDENLSAYPAGLDSVQDEEEVVERPQEGEEMHLLVRTNLLISNEEERKAEGQSILKTEADIPRALMSHRITRQRGRTSTSTSTIPTPSRRSSLLSWDLSVRALSSSSRLD